MIRISTLLWLGLSVGTGTLLFNVSQQTQDMRAQLVALERNIALEKQSLDVLHAEWSYLNRPARLRELAENHLALEPVTGFPVASKDNLIYFKSPAEMFPDPSMAGQNLSPDRMLFTNSQQIETRLPHLKPKALEEKFEDVPASARRIATPSTTTSAPAPVAYTTPAAAPILISTSHQNQDRKMAGTDVRDQQFRAVLNALEVN